MPTRTVVIAGAGIGGLTAALAAARHGLRVTVIEQAEQLEETGAGIQLSPNAARVLIALGLRDRLTPQAVVPGVLIVADPGTGRVLARAPLGTAAEKRYGAPYWVIHRGDLQATLLAAAQAHPAIDIRLGARVDDFAAQEAGIIVRARSGTRTVEEHGAALIGADGLWSNVRRRLGHRQQPHFAGHTAWRALVPADAVAAILRTPAVNLWLGGGAHLVHYPVKGGRLINVVAIVRDAWREPGWSAKGERGEILARFPARTWRGAPRDLLEAAPSWLKWAIYETAPLPHWGAGAVTLLGDAAHAMPPYLAQGAAMAIEDAAVLGANIAGAPDDPASALRRYEQQRLARTARVQRAARRNAALYHMTGVGGFLRTMALTAMGGERLLARYDWIYDWASD